MFRWYLLKWWPEVAEVTSATSVTSALCGRYLRRHLPEVKNFFTVQQEQIDELKHTWMDWSIVDAWKTGARDARLTSAVIGQTLIIIWSTNHKLNNGRQCSNHLLHVEYRAQKSSKIRNKLFHSAPSLINQRFQGFIQLTWPCTNCSQVQLTYTIQLRGLVRNFIFRSNKIFCLAYIDWFEL